MKQLYGAIAVVVVVILAGILLQTKARRQQSPATAPGYGVSVSPSVSPHQSPSMTGEIPLEITSPKDGSSVSQSSVVVSGTTLANAQVAINDTETKADAKGHFSSTVSLDEGDNNLAVVVNDDSGNSVEKELTVTFEQ